MLTDLPSYLAILFGAITLVTLLIFFIAVRKSSLPGNAGIALIISLVLLAIQAVLALNGFYENTHTVPPRLIPALAPSLVIILLLFLTRGGRRFIDSLPLVTLTWLNTIRIVVEIGLYYLCVHKAVPQLMTFEGSNFDVFSGITAPFIAWFGFVKKKLPRGLILAWNIICLLLVLNVVIRGILSVPTRFQQFAFDQPNIAVLYFPFVWLAAYIVPVVIFTHLVSIRQLSGKRPNI